MTNNPKIHTSGFEFLQTLKKNNNREWFNDNKTVYQQELVSVEAFADALLALLNSHDVIETPSGKQSLLRIYRDTRFSKDKTPYKTHWSGGFRRAAKYRRGGYYFQLEPGNTFVGGGFWAPVADDVKRIREDIAFDPTPLRKILSAKPFVSTFKTLQGEQLKKTPRGFDADHEAADLLRYKQYLLIRNFSDEEVLSDNFLKEADKTFRAMRPFLDYMSDVLSTDPNGLDV
ncbi:MAG TPA: DUF2461 domain-containing protein [Chitinophaga sp.]|uniref:DUF2461 domain-containing protein n=1 Tax=Chitinophaga sp. TaxID=1869181 RepID=UPI002C01C662|nr:DUF2461 domain-containing protein [Chitinophaga sp.]HVI46376.1 DUF2461 domain-containing protein [Chitinophaga sp.]